MNKTKFFDETFKVLLAVTVSTWLVYVAFIVFVGESESCAVGAPGWLFTTMAVTTGVMSAPPLVYGLVRLLMWPGGPKSGVKAGAWFVGTGVVLFVVAATLLALAISQYGCR